MPDLNDLLNQADAAGDDILALEQALVRIETVNTGSMPTGNETRACAFVSDWLGREGSESETPRLTPERGTITSRRDGRGAPDYRTARERHFTLHPDTPAG